MKRIFLFLLLIVPSMHAMEVETEKILKNGFAGISSLIAAAVKRYDEVRHRSMQRAIRAREEQAIHWIENQPHLDFDKALRDAIREKNIVLVKILLDRGAKIIDQGAGIGSTVTDIIGWYYGNNDMLRLVLSYNRHTRQTLTDALFYAITEKPECVPVLLEHGADINAYENFWPYKSVLWKALYWFPWKYPGTIKALLDYGADVNEKNHVGDTPLMYGIKDTRNIPEKDREEFVKLLSLHGADWSIKDGKGKTALDYAQGTIKKLLSDPLMIAANERHSKRLKTGSAGSVEIIYPHNWDEQISKAQARINNAIEYSKKLARLKSMAKKQQALLYCPVNKEA
ncbi:MAG TPA: hypothetical protein VFF04_02030 [Candidatus Babeliales bacterium]|nr:hypothetical protein [Candidatus Babeliales bacterium]